MPYSLTGCDLSPRVTTMHYLVRLRTRTPTATLKAAPFFRRRPGITGCEQCDSEAVLLVGDSPELTLIAALLTDPADTFQSPSQPPQPPITLLQVPDLASAAAQLPQMRCTQIVTSEQLPARQTTLLDGNGLPPPIFSAPEKLADLLASIRNRRRMEGSHSPSRNACANANHIRRE